MSTQSLTVKIGLTGLSSVTAGLRSVSASATAAVSGLTRLAAPVAALVTSVAGVAAVTSGLKGIVDLGGKINDLGLRTSVSARSLIRYREVFEEASKSAEDIGPTFDKTAKAIYEAATAGGAAETALNKLGFSATQLSAQAPEQQFEALSQAINALQNPTERSAIAMQIFGKSGGEMIPVFDAMKDMASTDGALGRLPEVLGRNVKVLDAIGDSFTQLGLKSQQFFAGVVDQLAPAIQPLLAELTQIDLTGLGQSVGAFVNVAIDEWKAGRFGEFVTLSIEAGFEQGGNAARRGFASLASFLSQGSFWASVGVGLLTGINEGLKLVASGILTLATPFAALGDYARDALTFAFLSAANALGEALAKTLNASVRFLNDKLGTSFQGFTYTPRETTAPSFSGSLASASEGQAQAVELINQLFDASSEAARSLAGMSNATGETFSATNKLGSLIDEMKRKREETAATEKQISSTLSGQIPIVNTLAAIRGREVETLRILRQLEDERARVQGSFALTEAQKYQQNLALLQAQRAELERMVALLREQAAMPGLTDSDRTQISSRADSFDQRLSGVTRELDGVGPDPNSTPEQMQAAMTELQDQFGTVAQGIARSFKTVIGTAVDSVSNGLQKLIGDTEYWSAKLGSIAGPIMGAVTASISRMFTEWIVQRGLAAAKNMLFSTQEGATDAAAKAPGALMSSISSYGIAAAVGGAAFLAAMALTGGFREGGYTGGGGLNDVAGVVHGREFVMNAATVERVGVPQLQAIQEGMEPAAAAPSSGGGGAVNIATFDSRMDARRWAKSQDAETWFVDMARRTAHKT